MKPVKVTWIAARRTALARAMAIFISKKLGEEWVTIPSSRRARMVRECEDMLMTWVRSKVILAFRGEYREHDDPDALADWTKLN